LAESPQQAWQSLIWFSVQSPGIQPANECIHLLFGTCWEIEDVCIGTFSCSIDIIVERGRVEAQEYLVTGELGFLWSYNKFNCGTQSDARVILSVRTP
jgi:hypothetical protein